MKHKRNIKAALLSACRSLYSLLPLMAAGLIALAFFSCTSEDYRTGNGDYSYYAAEMALLSLSDSLINEAELDDGRTLELCSPLKSSVLRKNFKQSVVGDSCRLMLYYNKGIETATAVKATEVHGANQVMMPRILLADTLKTPVKTDPLNVISSWKSKNGGFYNYNISVKAGVADGEAQSQTIGFVCDSVTVAGNDETVVHLRLVHDQKDIPQFYSVEAFLSISRVQVAHLIDHYGIAPASTIKVNLTANTYQGQKAITL